MQSKRHEGENGKEEVGHTAVDRFHERGERDVGCLFIADVLDLLKNLFFPAKSLNDADALKKLAGLPKANVADLNSLSPKVANEISCGDCHWYKQDGEPKCRESAPTNEKV